MADKVKLQNALTITHGVKRVLSDPSKWTQGSAGRNAHGDRTAATDETTVCWCLLGAYEKALVETKLTYGDGGDTALDAFEAVTGSVVAFNDAPYRTFTDVQAALNKASAQLEQRITALGKE